MAVLLLALLPLWSEAALEPPGAIYDIKVENIHPVTPEPPAPIILMADPRASKFFIFPCASPEHL